MKKILFFVNGFAPTPEDMKAASKLDGEVSFRNVQIWEESQPLEKCHCVAGAAPSPYVEKFGTCLTKKAAEANADSFEKKESK